MKKTVGHFCPAEYDGGVWTHLRVPISLENAQRRRDSTHQGYAPSWQVKGPASATEDSERTETTSENMVPSRRDEGLAEVEEKDALLS